MIFYSITISNLIWIIYTISEGVRESFFSHYKNQCKRINEYKCSNIFYLQRIIVLILTSLILIKTLNIIAIPFIIGQLFMFNFFYKISYTQTSRKIGNQQTNDNKIDKFNNHLLILGIVLQIFVYIFML